MIKSRLTTENQYIIWFAEFWICLTGINLRCMQVMASSKEYLQFVLGQLSDLDEITYRAMMGEFIIYYRGKIIGGIYDDRLLVKPNEIEQSDK